MDDESQPDGAPGPLVAMTRNGAGVITTVDQSITELLGWRPADWIGLPSTTFIHPEDQVSAIAAWMTMITSPGTTLVWRGRYQTADGSWRWVETRNVSDGEEQATIRSTMRAITGEQVTVEEELRAREQLLTRLSDALPLGVFQIDPSHRVTFSNDRFHAIVGRSSGAATVEGVLHSVAAEDRPRLLAAVASALADEPVDGLEIRVQVPDPAGATERVCLLSLRPLTDTAGAISGAVGCISDETDRARLRRELERRASVDDLTSCLNRAATIAVLDDVARLVEPGGGNAVVYLDLDRFKAVNDGCGHAAGDQLLLEVCRRIRASLRKVDHVGRIGGDEFLVVCPDVASASLATEIATRIADATTFAFECGGHLLPVRASVGVAWSGAPLDSDAFIARADEAMYQAKRTGTHVVLAPIAVR